MTNHLDELTLYEYLDGELDAAANQSISAHLTTCPACQAQLTRLQQLFTTLDSLPEAPLTVDLTPRIMAAVRPAVKPALPTWWRWVVVAEGVAAAVLALFLWPFIASLWEPMSVAFSLSELTAPLLAWWAEWQPSFILEWPTLPPLALALPIIIWLGVLGVLVGVLGNGLLLRSLFQPMPSTSQRGKHV